MSAQNFKSSKGHGWEVKLGARSYWFGRGLSGYLLGPYASRIQCEQQVASDIKRVELEDFYRQLEADFKMIAEARPDWSPDEEYVVYELTIDDEVVGYCVDTPSGPIEEVFGEADYALAAAQKQKASNVTPITPQF